MKRAKKQTRHRKGTECQCKLNQLRVYKKAKLMGMFYKNSFSFSSSCYYEVLHFLQALNHFGTSWFDLCCRIGSFLQVCQEKSLSSCLALKASCISTQMFSIRGSKLTSLVEECCLLYKTTPPTFPDSSQEYSDKLFMPQNKLLHKLPHQILLRVLS